MSYLPWTVLRRKSVSSEWRKSSPGAVEDRKSTRLNSSHLVISYAVFCLKKKKKTEDANSITIEDITSNARILSDTELTKCHYPDSSTASASSFQSPLHYPDTTHTSICFS